MNEMLERVIFWEWIKQLINYNKDASREVLFNANVKWVAVHLFQKHKTLSAQVWADHASRELVKPVFHSALLAVIKSKNLTHKGTKSSVTLSRAWVILVVSVRWWHIHTRLRRQSVRRGCSQGGFRVIFLLTRGRIPNEWRIMYLSEEGVKRKICV